MFYHLPNTEYRGPTMAVPFQVIFAKVATFPFHPNQCCIWSNISAQHYGGGGGGREGNIGDKEINAKSIQ